MGDCSGAIIHPFFIHLSHLAGCQVSESPMYPLIYTNVLPSKFYQERLGYYCLLPTQAGHLMSTLEAFASMREENDPFSLAQASWTMCIVYTHPQNLAMARRHLKMSMDIVQRNNIRFVPNSKGRTSSHAEISNFVPVFTEAVHERTAFLANLVHAETFIYLAAQPGGGYYPDNSSYEAELGVSITSPSRAVFLMQAVYSDVYSEPSLTQNGITYPELETQFRYDLPVSAPSCFNEKDAEHLS